MDSSSDEEQNVYEQVTDPNTIKALERKEKKANIQPPPLIEDDRQQIKPKMVTNEEVSKMGNQRGDKKGGKNGQKMGDRSHEQKQRDYKKNEGKKKQKESFKNDSKKIQYKEKQSNERKNPPEKKMKYEQKGQKNQKLKEKQSKNQIEVDYNCSVQTIIEKVKGMIKQYNFISLVGVGSVPIQKIFLAVEELHQIYKNLKRINIPGTIKEEGKTKPKISVELSLHENELNARHMGYQQWDEERQREKPQKRNRRKDDSDDSRDYR